jgi:hypothetical protein
VLAVTAPLEQKLSADVRFRHAELREAGSWMFERFAIPQSALTYVRVWIAATSRTYFSRLIIYRVEEDGKFFEVGSLTNVMKTSPDYLRWAPDVESFSFVATIPAPDNKIISTMQDGEPKTTDVFVVLRTAQNAMMRVPLPDQAETSPRQDALINPRREIRNFVSAYRLTGTSSIELRTTLVDESSEKTSGYTPGRVAIAATVMWKFNHETGQLVRSGADSSLVPASK